MSIFTTVLYNCSVFVGGWFWFELRRKICIFSSTSVQLCTNKNVWLRLVHVTHISSRVYLRLGLFGMNPVNGCSCWLACDSSVFTNTRREPTEHTLVHRSDMWKKYFNQKVCARGSDIAWRHCRGRSWSWLFCMSA